MDKFEEYKYEQLYNTIDTKSTLDEIAIAANKWGDFNCTLYGKWKISVTKIRDLQSNPIYNMGYTDVPSS